ncbi:MULTISPECIES: FGGY-family carbohydrate kinase [unclassified Roseitalea]|uniref:xylulokinase n=1 Tax=unclassified Roseitalea TaxID=2639107 RepID=UPI00273F4DB5|nr:MULTISPECIES: FGGY-family carbohydrate kinase [unclassified Roseitalea]
MDDGYLIGMDVGTTAVKAAVFDADGAIVDRYVGQYPITRQQGGRVEQDPEDWMRHVLAALSQFQANVDLARVHALGLSSQVNTHVFVDAEGRALAPAIVWQDGRAAAEAAELDGRIAEADKLAWWGAPLPVDASHCLSRMAHMARHAPDIWARTDKVLLPKDFCIGRLTGARLTDPISNVGLIDPGLCHVAPLLSLVDGAAERLVPIAPMTAIAGEVRQGLPGAGLKVAIGTMDAWSGMLGVGVTAPGQAYYLSGTSEIVGIVSDDVAPTPGVIAFPRCEGIRLHVGPTQSGGASKDWFCRLMGIAPDAMADLAARAGARAHVPLFVPHLQGERAPIWDADARGMFLELDASAGAPELARAVYEGVAHSARWLLDTLRQSAVQAPQSVRSGGGGFRSDVWNQIRADVLGVRLERVAVTDPGVLGAAGIASVAAGLHTSLAEAFDALVSIDRVYEPDPAMAPYYDERFARYKRAYFNNNRR